MKTLTSFLPSICETGVELEWQDLMECFVCAVIGLESKSTWCDGMFSFDWDDVFVDGHGTTRINMFTSHSGESPPPSPQPFSADMTSLSNLFLALIEQLSVPACLPSNIDKHFRDNLIPFVLRRLINLIISTGHVVPIFDPSQINAIVRQLTDAFNEQLPSQLGLFDTLMWMPTFVYLGVHGLESNGLTKHKERLTDIDCLSSSPQYKQFSKLLDPELAAMRQQFDSNLFEEAKRITLWKEFLQKVASGEEILNDTSFLKLSFFRPTLLSLQSKHTQMASSADVSPGSSTSSVDSSLSSPHTSLEVHHDSSLRTLSSSPQFKQESLRLLTILHSLVVSHLSSIPSSQKIQREQFIHPFLLTSFAVDADPTEKFHSSLFDEEDDEILAQSLIRCHAVCRLVGDEQCIVDVWPFFDRTVSVLGSSNAILRITALSLFNCLEDEPCVLSQLPLLSDRLSSAFRDGQPEEQFALIRISSRWMSETDVEESRPKFSLAEFDWEGLLAADLSWMSLFIASLDLIESLRRFSIREKSERDEATRIILSFEQHQHAISQINSDFDEITLNKLSIEDAQSLVAYSLLMTHLMQCDFPVTLTNFLTSHPELDCGSLLLIFENILLILCHTSLNPHKQHPPPLDLIFERVLQTNPVDFFIHLGLPVLTVSRSLLNTSLCGLHALCQRGVLVDIFESEVVLSSWHLVNMFWMFHNPVSSDTFDLFLYFPPPLVVRFLLPVLWLDSDYRFAVDRLKVMMITLLLVTAPLGDCHSLKELFRSDRHRHDIHNSSAGSDFTHRFQSLEWLNIPTGFGSALAHSNPRVSPEPFEGQNQPHISLDGSSPRSQVPNVMFQYLSQQAQNVSRRISLLGSLVHKLTRANVKSLVFGNVHLRALCRTVLSVLFTRSFLQLTDSSRSFSCVGVCEETYLFR
ncbi:hypothetical protein BLNAU_21820 [Blattamonas nauphoetae]|uniref:Uncharacterized protein n=1 Tax=Blattamonas nauphoetae TaxID=2049346 RepID=A0ABQ9WVB0_9EUKA|nr:hypothetical protein BLNAU_21820 [Blattamonas nauphoetae]